MTSYMYINNVMFFQVQKVVVTLILDELHNIYIYI